MPSTRGEFHLVSFLLSSSGTQRSTPRNNCSLKFIIFPTLNLVNFHEYRIFFTRNEYRRLEAIISNKISQKKKKSISILRWLSSNEDNNNAKQ